MKKQIIAWVSLYFVFGVLFSLISLGKVEMDSSYHVYEDRTGKLQIGDVRGIFEMGGGQVSVSNAFSYGASDSVIWIQVPVKKAKNIGMYLSVYSQTVKSARLYVPTKLEGALSYEMYEAGWEAQSGAYSRFLYPVFSLDNVYLEELPAYLRLHSPYTQNYLIESHSQGEFEDHKIWITLLYGLIFGVLIAICMQIVFLATRKRRKIREVFTLYFLIMTLYQMGLMGIVNFYFPQVQYFVMSNLLMFVVASLMTYIWCIQRYIENRAGEKQRRYFTPLYALILFGLVFLVQGNLRVANMYYHFMSVVSITTVFVIASHQYIKTKNKVYVKLVHMTGILVVAVCISLLKSRGFLPNNYLTMHIILFAECIQAIIIMDDLRQSIHLMEDKQRAAHLDYMLEKQRKEHFETAFLNAQIRPHFIFNTINTTAYLCKKDGERASHMLMNLAMYLRYSFDRSSRTAMVSVEEELECVRAYTDIEQTRFPDQIQIVYELNYKSGFSVPVLCIQPLVENAILHGVRKKSGQGTVTIQVLETEKGHEIRVADDGVGMDEEKKKMLEKFEQTGEGGVALANIHSRLLELYGKGLSIESDVGKGTVVSFEVFV